MLVMKFGAVSVSDAARLRDVVTIVKSEARGPSVVICTALAGMTDTLIGAARGGATGDEALIDAARRELWGRHRALAERLVTDEWEREALYREWADLLKTFDRVTRSIATLGEPSPRGTDAVAALGERFIAHLFAVVLRQGGVAARVVDAAELIVTDDHYGAARPFLNESIERVRARLRPLLQAGITPVITGYIGATRDRVVTTLGRGGGDYTAALIGVAMDAEEVCLWTDVDGILTADPKIVPSARTLAELSYDEAVHITTFGADVLHPRTLVPLKDTTVPLRIRSVFHLDRAGTGIILQPSPSSRPARTIISTAGLCMLRVSIESSDTRTHDALARTLTRLVETGVDILTFAQSFSEHSLTFTVRSSDAAFVRDTVAMAQDPQQPNGPRHHVEVLSSVALVAVISAGGSPELTPRALAALGKAGAHVLAMARGADFSHLSFVLPEAEVEPVVRALHAELGLAQ